MEMNEIVLKEKERSLHISRIPKNTKEVFTELAESEFTDDFGLCFKWCLEQALEYQRVKEVILDTNIINNILEKKQEVEKKEEKPKNTIRMLDGTKRYKEVKSNE